VCVCVCVGDSGLTLCASGDEEVKMRLLRMRLETLVRSGETLAADQALETFQQVVLITRQHIRGFFVGLISHRNVCQ